MVINHLQTGMIVQVVVANEGLVRDPQANTPSNRPPNIVIIRLVAIKAHGLILILGYGPLTVTVGNEGL